MQTDSNDPPFPNNPKPESVAPPLPASEPPVIAAPPRPAAASLPPPLPHSNRNSLSSRDLLAILLSLCLGLFLADGVISLVDESLIFFFDLHLLSIVRGLVFFFAVLTAIVIYGLMGLTPMIPKRLFLPLTLFIPVGELLLVPFSIYAHSRIQQAAWGLSVCQVILGLSILYWVRGGFKFRWPLVPEDQLGVRRFSWRNLSVFIVINVFLLLPVVVVYLLVCAALAVDHFTDGFMALRPGGVTVQVRKYVRNDGKTIQLFPMAHVADAAFYQKVSQSFPTNSIILLEGVTDNKNLLTNHITYKRMATALGLGEQHEDFKPGQGELVRADVDVDQFASSTIGLLNVVMLLHAKGVTLETVLKLIQYSEPPGVQEQLMDDLLKKRNKHLLEEIQARLSQSENIIVPWGAAHMPEIAKEIQKSGFRLDESKEYVVIRFHPF
jgi:hypothetical protein